MRHLEFSKGFITETKHEPEVINEFLGTLIVCSVLGVIGTQSLLNVWKHTSGIVNDILKQRKERKETLAAMKNKKEDDRSSEEDDKNEKELKNLLKKKHDDLSPKELKRIKELESRVDTESLSKKERDSLSEVTGKKYSDFDEENDVETEKKKKELEDQRNKSLRLMMAYEKAIDTLPDGTEKDNHKSKLNMMVRAMSGVATSDDIKNLEKVAKEELNPEAEKLKVDVEKSVDKISDSDLTKWKEQKGISDKGLEQSVENVQKEEKKEEEKKEDENQPDKNQSKTAEEEEVDKAIEELENKHKEAAEIDKQFTKEKDPEKRKELQKQCDEKLKEIAAARETVETAQKNLTWKEMENELDTYTKECKEMEKEYDDFWNNSNPDDPDWEEKCKEHESKIAETRQKIEQVKEKMNKVREENRPEGEQPEKEGSENTGEEGKEGKEGEEGEESDDIKVGDERTDNDDDLDDEEWGMTKDRKLSISNNQDPRKVFKQRTYKRGNKTFKTKSYYSKKGISITRDEYRERIAAWNKKNKKQSKQEVSNESFIKSSWTMMRLSDYRKAINEASEEVNMETICKERLVYIKYVIDSTSNTSEKSKMEQMYDAIYNCCFDKNGKVRTMEDLYNYLNQVMIENEGKIPGLPTNDQVLNIDKKCKAWRELSKDKFDKYMAELDKENLNKAGTEKVDKAQDILSPEDTTSDSKALSKIRELSTIYGFTNILGLESTRQASKEDDEKREEIKKQQKDRFPQADSKDSKDVKADDISSEQIDKIIGVGE